MFHDYDLNKIEGIKDAIQNIYNENISKGNRRWIGMKFPVQVNNAEDFSYWMNL